MRMLGFATSLPSAVVRVVWRGQHASTEVARMDGGDKVGTYSIKE